MKKRVSILALCFVILTQLFTLGKIVYSESNQPKIPNLSFHVAPNPIGSMQQVSLNVSIDSSFNELPDPTRICFDIPSILIRQNSDFKNQVMPDYLSWLSTEDDGENTHVCYQLNPVGQQYFEFSIQFTSDLLLEGQVLPEYVISAYLNETNEEQDTIKVNPDILGEPHFAKFRKFAADPVDGLGLLDLNYPNYNTYELVFNRDFSGEFEDVKITDQLANGTKLDQTFSGWSDIPGNRDAIDGLRVYQIDETVSEALENRQYVTEKFSNAIMYDEKAGTFEVNLGTVPKSISYVVQYAVEVTDGNLGTYTNTANLIKGSDNPISKSSTEKIKSNGNGKGFFEKEVDKSELYLPDRLLTYTLKVGGVGYTLPSETIFFDYLPEGVIFKGINSKTAAGFELVSVEKNKVTFKTTKEFTNYSENLYFDAEYSSSIFPQTLNNTAYIQKDNGTYYSNTVQTEVKGNRSVILTKSDNNNNMLSGAYFDLYSENGIIVKKDLVSNEEGIVTVDELDVGLYYFVETKAPEGYELDEKPVHFEIKESQVNPLNLNKINRLATNINFGKVILTKVDAENKDKKLEGAFFKLQTVEGNIIEEGLQTNKDGKIEIDGLEPGEYEFLESQSPKGYVLDTEPVRFFIEENSSKSVYVTKSNSLINNLTGTESTGNNNISGQNNKLPGLGKVNDRKVMVIGLFILLISVKMYKKIKTT